MHPQPAGSLQAKSKSRCSVGDQLQYYVLISVQRGDTGSWFYFRPPAHLQKKDLGCFSFYFFSRGRPGWLHHQAPRKHIRKYFLWLSADACLPINQVTLVSSSRLPSHGTKYSGCSCYRLSWWPTLCTSTSTTNTIWLWAVLKWMMGRCKVMC